MSLATGKAGALNSASGVLLGSGATPCVPWAAHQIVASCTAGKAGALYSASGILLGSGAAPCVPGAAQRIMASPEVFESCYHHDHWLE
ncbi:hypothetical protein NDU88_000874 [Pleurodeles waltl]|uniref:Uncharacterized protein n=1 Tax=Pleurodeles waltl TaxID=8319 RepID=A0AAV7TG91_PLEWA|nr:hypothetical protein NDU88_000874 [Pleurodeles waltl]